MPVPRTLSVALGLTLATPALAQDPGTVQVRVDETYTDLGNLHVTVTTGTSFSHQERLFVGGSGLFELTPNLSVDAAGFFPVARLDSDLGSWFQAEAAVRLHRTSLDVEDEPIELSRSEDDGTRTVEYVNVPTLTRNSMGVSAGVVARSGAARPDPEGELTDSFHLMPTVGLSGLQAVGTKVNVEGYGDRGQFRWLGGGLDLMVDAVRSYDVAPPDALGRFGGRLHATSVFGRTNRPGLGGRLEFAYLPGGQGMAFTAAIGAGLNAGL